MPKTRNARMSGIFDWRDRARRHHRTLVERPTECVHVSPQKFRSLAIIKDAIATEPNLFEKSSIP